MDPLLAEINPRVIVLKYYLYNTPEEGIILLLSTVIRRSAE